jgi:hypothetical protein
VNATIRNLALALVAAGNLAACASTNPTDYLSRCGAPAPTAGPSPRVYYTPEQAACANTLAREAQARNEAAGAAVAGVLVGAMAGAAVVAAQRPAYYAPPPRRSVTCSSIGSSFGTGGSRFYNGSTTCY